MAAQTGRTPSKFIRFLVDDSGGVLREIPVNSISAVGLVYEEQDMTAFQDAVKSVLANMPEAPIEISGPVDTSAAQAAASSGNAPALSGSHTVLSGIVGGQTPLALDVRFGIRQYWVTGEPTFGITGSSTNGYICTSYTVDPSAMTYTAKFNLFAGSAAPSWDTAAHT